MSRRPKAHLDIYRTKAIRRSQRWAWRLVAENGRTIATSGEGYANRAECAARGRAIVFDIYDVKVSE